MIIGTLNGIFGGWQDLYADSLGVSTGVMVIHLLALLVAGGFAVAADRATLRATRWSREQRAHHLDELHNLHRPVVIALGVLMVSGLAMAVGDLELYAFSTLFWVKMGMVALLLANGLLLLRTEQRIQHTADEPGSTRYWGRLRLASMLSILLWIGTAAVGEVLVVAA